jgi:DNA polymerase-3 subunit epsilon
MRLRDRVRLLPAFLKLHRHPGVGTRFIAVDFESANNNPCSVCAVGYAIADKGRVVTTGYWLCRPFPDFFEPASIQVHGIRPYDVQDAKTFADILARLRAIAGDRPWVAHNSGSEAMSVRDFCTRKGVAPPDNPILCSQKLYEKFMPGRKAGLASASAVLGIRLDLHDARSDAKASAEIVNRVLLESGETDLSAMIARYGLSMAPISSRTHLPRKEKELSRITIPIPREAAGSGDARNGPVRRLHPFFGTVLSIEGEIDGMSRAEVERAVREKGGRVVRGVNFMTDYFVEGKSRIGTGDAAPTAPAPLPPTHGTSHPHDHAHTPAHTAAHVPAHAATHAHAAVAAEPARRRGRSPGGSSVPATAGPPRTRRSKAEDLIGEGRRIRILDQHEFLALLESNR